MCDAFLVLAQTTNGLSCFLMPRWRPDGSKNPPWQVQQLKNKMGNVANASSEVEIRGALAWMVGEEGRGVRTIIEMVAMTRFDCMIGSAAGMRQAVAQATHHCHNRSAFGATLSDQPLMQNVLADLIIENEAALAYTMRVARAMDNQNNEHERLLARLATPPVGKYWICKRTPPNHAYEAMECIGGSGVMEDCIMPPRLFRESPVNAIWEAAATSSAWTPCAPCRKNPKPWTPSSKKRPKPVAPTAASTSTWHNCNTTSPTSAISSTGPATWSTAWPWPCRVPCYCASATKTSPTHSAPHACKAAVA